MGFLKCPECGAELLEVGYPDEFGFQKYRCPNDCKFKSPITWKILNAFGYVIWLTVIVLFLAISAPFIVANYLVEKVF